MRSLGLHVIGIGYSKVSLTLFICAQFIFIKVSHLYSYELHNHFQKHEKNLFEEVDFLFWIHILCHIDILFVVEYFFLMKLHIYLWTPFVAVSPAGAQSFPLSSHDKGCMGNTEVGWKSNVAWAFESTSSSRGRPKASRDPQR